MTEIDSETGKLDRKRSFGVVYGDPNVGYFQDNKPFRHDGTPHVPPPPAIPTVKPEQMVGVTSTPVSVPEPVNRPLTHSEKMKQVWANRRAQEQEDANAQR